MSVISIERLAAPVGAVVSDASPERMRDDAEFATACLESLERHGVLVFNRLGIDDDSLIAFSRLLGEVERVGLSEPREIFRVTLDPAKNRAAAYLRGTFDWHIDGCTEDIPIKATLLAAHAVASSGGETEFASTYAAYDDLTDAEKSEFESLRVVHTIEASQRLVNSEPSPEEVAMWRKRPSKEHPLVWQHSTGRKSLVLGATTSHIVGMPPEDGRALLDDLQARATVPERVYRHEWSVGDLVIWDNRGVMHRACPYDPTSARDMHRTTITGDEPIR